MLRQYFLFAIVLLISLCSYAEGKEQPLKIQGQVFDEETSEPLPFAHIQVGEVRTITNIDGEFSVTVPIADNVEIAISFIGYKTFKSPVERNESQFHVSLKPATTQLEAVTVTTGESVIAQVFNKLKLNYELDQQHLVCYYKESLNQDDDMYYLAEGILDVYQPSEVSTEPIEISPIRTRKQELKEVDEEVVMIHGHATDMLQSIVRREKSFVHLDNFKHYTYHYEGVSEYDGKEIFVLSFEPQTKKAKTKGKLYVDADSYAIIRAEYYPLVDNDWFWDEVSWVEEFSKTGVRWNLNRVTYAGKWTIDSLQYSYESTLVVNKSNVVNVPPALGLLLGEKDIFFDAVDDFSDDFWEGYNHVQLNEAEKAALTKHILSE